MEKTTSKVKKGRLECRIFDSDKERLLEAAKIERLSLSDFVMKAALEAAETTAMKEREFTISSEDWHKLFHNNDCKRKNISRTRSWLQEKGIDYERQGID